MARLDAPHDLLDVESTIEDDAIEEGSLLGSQAEEESDGGVDEGSNDGSSSGSSDGEDDDDDDAEDAYPASMLGDDDCVQLLFHESNDDDEDWITVRSKRGARGEAKPTVEPSAQPAARTSGRFWGHRRGSERGVSSTVLE